MNERITGTDQKLSAVNDRITATDQKLAEAADADHGSAARSADETIVNSTVMNALNYQLVDKADVMFGFNKAILTPAAMAALDTIVAKVQETPRAVVELAGFTDQVGSPNYNLELSRRRAWAVQRYLVEHNVPTRAIHVVGLGEEQAPEGTESTVHKMSHRKSSGNGAERRVNIRVFGPGESAASSSGQ
jgi:outer membrane protein OmpA-like peptidoglycan-associated protein